MKINLFLLLFYFALNSFSQNEVYYLKDSVNTFTKENIHLGDFHKLEKQILEPYSDDVYWFKIPRNKTNDEYIFRILYERINTAKAYKNQIELQKLEYQRYLSYSFLRDFDVYIKVNPELHAYIPYELDTEKKILVKESNQLLLNGFYYGFAVIIIIYNLSYFILFRDDAFLYYSLFLSSMVVGVFTMDGMLNFYNIKQNLNNIIMILNYIALAFFSSKFVNSYLLLDLYYPKLKRYSYVAGILMICLGILYLNLADFFYLLLLNILVFGLLLAYWISAVSLFNKNFYIKILAFAYVIILFSGIDFFVLKFLGISFINVDATTIKIGAFLEMIILSIAVLYRMKILKEENEFMKEEIIKFSDLLNEKDQEKNTDLAVDNIKNLSLREREIFDLILLGKSNKEIASTINISINTVKFHIKNIYEKLHIKNRKEAYNLSVN
jgi:DNA-binding CsgD family transcriptional regulator